MFLSEQQKIHNSKHNTEGKEQNQTTDTITNLKTCIQNYNNQDSGDTDKRTIKWTSETEEGVQK